MSVCGEQNEAYGICGLERGHPLPHLGEYPWSAWLDAMWIGLILIMIVLLVATNSAWSMLMFLPMFWVSWEMGQQEKRWKEERGL